MISDLALICSLCVQAPGAIWSFSPVLSQKIKANHLFGKTNHIIWLIWQHLSSVLVTLSHVQKDVSQTSGKGTMARDASVYPLHSLGVIQLYKGSDGISRPFSSQSWYFPPTALCHIFNFPRLLCLNSPNPGEPGSHTNLLQTDVANRAIIGNIAMT